MNAPSEPQAHGVRIAVSPGHADISIDGTALPAGQIVGYQLEHDVANAAFPRLILHTRPTSDVLFEGMAQVAVAVPQDPGQAIADFVSQLDPAALQRAAMDREDLTGDKTGVTEAILKQITEWALGGRDART